LEQEPLAAVIPHIFLETDHSGTAPQSTAGIEWNASAFLGLGLEGGFRIVLDKPTR
jgi:hypothetical protein